MKRQKITRLLLLAISISLVFSITAFADDAVIDILDNPRFSGAVTWVNVVGKWVDQWFAAFISFTSFFIISASCLRNVLAGAYCVFPKFWDKVDEAHKAMESISIASVQSAFSGGAWKNTVSTGSITQFFFRCLPNVKVLTDFEDAQDPDYKQYFMRAIPQCVCAVFVGVFIYNGLYRDVMKVTSSFGSTMVSQVISTIKPEDILYKLTNISGTPPYPVKDAKDGTDHIADVIVTAAKGHILNEYTDQQEKKHKSSMFQALSNKAVELSKQFDAYSNVGTWKVSAMGDGVSVGTEPQMPAEHLSDDGMQYTAPVVFNVQDLGLTTEYHKGEAVYVYMTLSFKNQGSSDKQIAQDKLNDLILHIDPTVAAGGKVQYKNPTSTGGSFQSDKETKIGNTAVTVGNSTLEFANSGDISWNTPYQATNLFYGSNGVFYKVTTVVYEKGIQPTLTSAEYGLKIKCGESIQEAYNKVKNSNTSSKTETTSAETNSSDDDDLDPDD